MDFAVIGGGIVGASVAYGLAAAGERVTIFDEGDVAFRAARGNLGNVWVQGKGANAPVYADLTRMAAAGWAPFADALADLTGVDLHFRRPGGFHLCFSEDELAKRAAMIAALAARTRVASRVDVLDRGALCAMLPAVGPTVAGATYCPDDGTANPLRLLRALIAATQRLGGTYRPQARAERVVPDGAGFAVVTANGVHRAARVVLAAGLGNVALAPALGLAAPVRPVRGQILVTEKVAPFLRYGMSFIRQTVEGGCVIGESSEEAGFDEGTTLPVLHATARRAVAAFPRLAAARLIRAWGALRVMSADGLPIYQQSEAYPGAFLLSVHSGVTLAPFHAGAMAAALHAGRLAEEHACTFSPGRFGGRADRAA
jgi:glycine/D-amino acid oxidase-like deaminating enzyme